MVARHVVEVVLCMLVLPAATFVATAPLSALRRPASQGVAGFSTAGPKLRILVRQKAQVMPVCQQAIMCAAAAEEPASPLARFRAWVKKWAKFDKDTLKALGVDAFFTYGIVSNVNAGLTVALAWGTFSKASGLSPLAPGQWKSFMITYAGIYATLGTVLRPFRFALAVSCTPLYSRVIASLRERLPYRTTRPALNRTLALVVVSLFFNVVGTFAIIGLGIWVSSLFTGVPPIPPKL